MQWANWTYRILKLSLEENKVEDKIPLQKIGKNNHAKSNQQGERK